MKLICAFLDIFGRVQEREIEELIIWDSLKIYIKTLINCVGTATDQVNLEGQQFWILKIESSLFIRLDFRKVIQPQRASTGYGDKIDSDDLRIDDIVHSVWQTNKIDQLITGGSIKNINLKGAQHQENAESTRDFQSELFLGRSYQRINKIHVLKLVGVDLVATISARKYFVPSFILHNCDYHRLFMRWNRLLVFEIEWTASIGVPIHFPIVSIGD